jgi:hypothetical protein
MTMQKIAPPIRTISAATLAKARPVIEMLMAEQNLTPESALNVAMDPVKLRRFVGVTLSEPQKHVVAMMASDARTRPGTSVQETRSQRGTDAVAPPFSPKKPSETDAQYLARLKRQIQGLPVAGPPMAIGTKAVPSDAGASYPLDASEPGSTYQLAKQARLASGDRDLEITSHGTVVGAADTTAQKTAALALMKSKGQNTVIDQFTSKPETKARYFSEYKAALKEVRK